MEQELCNLLSSITKLSWTVDVVNEITLPFGDLDFILQTFFPIETWDHFYQEPNEISVHRPDILLNKLNRPLRLRKFSFTPTQFKNLIDMFPYHRRDNRVSVKGTDLLIHCDSSYKMFFPKELSHLIEYNERGMVIPLKVVHKFVEHV